MGGIYGGLLSRAGFDVTLIDVREDHLGVIQRQGLTIDGVRGHHVVRVPAKGFAGLPPADLAIIFTDTNATRQAAQTAAAVLEPEGCALTLQNGIETSRRW